MSTLLKKGKLVRTDVWREGKWLDLWSVVHVLSGLLVGFFSYFVGIDALLGIVLAIVVFTVYELFEVYVEIEEAPTNRFMDVVIGMVGYIPAFFLIAPLLTEKNLILTFLVLLTFNGALSVAGWRASQKAYILEKRLRSNLTDKRKRLKEKSKKFRSKHHL